MITRVPMNISAGTRDARELLVSLLVESLGGRQTVSTIPKGKVQARSCNGLQWHMS